MALRGGEGVKSLSAAEKAHVDKRQARIDEVEAVQHVDGEHE